jgi:hypothetical protein
MKPPHTYLLISSLLKMLFHQVRKVVSSLNEGLVTSGIVSYGYQEEENGYPTTIILLFIGIGIDIVSIVFESFAIIMDIVTFHISNGGSFVSLAISVLLLYYLYRPHVKSYFGKISTSTTTR